VEFGFDLPSTVIVPNVPIVPRGVCSIERSYVRGSCDSCDRDAELFELLGREDRNCSECDSDLSAMIVLYETLNDAERLGMDGSELQNEVIEILHRYSSHVR
jgi:hypothetical protein